jgi:hypothetical protein
MRIVLVTLLLTFLAGCASPRYSETTAATYKGAIDVRWIKNDYFLFVPDSADPFVITRPNGKQIVPGRMYTDGGSIPRFLWGVTGLSPWGYAPAYIAHDWIFHAHQCKLQPPHGYTFEDSVAVMAESLKAVMEYDKDVRDYFLFDSIVSGVASQLAERIWNKGECKLPPPEVRRLLEGAEPPGDLVMRISFPR